MNAAKVEKPLSSESTAIDESEVNRLSDPQPAEVSDSTTRPSTEVEPKTDRRQFTAAYKRSIIEQADRCRGEGEIGALLRREGLYSSHLSNWRRAKREGTLDGTKSRSRGPIAPVDGAAQREITRLKTQTQRLEHELEKARTIIEVQKKLSTLLAMTPSEGGSS